MKITKETNLQNIDFVGVTRTSQPSKITRFESISAGITVGIVGAGSIMCFIGDIDMARKIFVAGIIAGATFFVMKKRFIK